MTLEAWVPTSAMTQLARRDYKGDDNYYLEATSAERGVPAGGAVR